MVSLDALHSFKSFEDFRREFEEDIKKIDNPIRKANLCLDIAGLYKIISRIDGIREEAKKEADYFLQASAGYEMQFGAQKKSQRTFYKL